jgi:hypothetical protein
LREAPGLGAGVADRVEVGESVDDHEVGESPGAGEFPVRLHAGKQRGVGDEPPRFVVDDKALAAGRIGERSLHPRRRASHYQSEKLVRAGDVGQVEREHRQVGVERDGGGPVEETGEVPSYQPAEGMGDFSAIGCELLRAGPGVTAGRGVEMFDDNGQDRRRRRTRPARLAARSGPTSTAMATIA